MALRGPAAAGQGPRDELTAPDAPGGAQSFDRAVAIQVLGRLEARTDSRRLDLGGPKQRLVLALLVSAGGRRVSIERLIEAVWGDPTPDGARRTAQTYVSNLRGVLGNVIRRDASGYVLDVEATLIDARRFEAEVAAALDHVQPDPVGGADRLRSALALWHGRPYADVDDRGELEPEATRLEELRLVALEARIDADLRTGTDSALIPELEALTTEYPLRERFRQQQMLALYRAGRQADALRVYHRTRGVLAEELGIEPSPQLRELESRILNQDPGLDLEPRTETRVVLLAEPGDALVPGVAEIPARGVTRPPIDMVVRDAVTAGSGQLLAPTGPTIRAVFADIGAAARAAAAVQRRLVIEDPDDGPARGAHIALDVGEVEVRGAKIAGPPLHRAARLVAAGHDGQVLLSASAHQALSELPDGGWQVRSLGEFRIRGFGSPQRVYQLVVDGLRDDFPPLRPDRESRGLPGADFGRVVRGFELRELIGGGDFGVVYRAYQASVGREVAVKVIRPEYANQLAFIRTFEAEAQLVARLEHPHVVPLYDFWRDPDGAYLVMRWMRGGSLRRALERGPYHTGPALRLLEEVASALAHAHRLGIVHRDLKPGNVLLDEDGRAYLSDFGIAARLVDASEHGAPLTASREYITPEERRGANLTARADVFGLGLLTYELLTGAAPPAPGELSLVGQRSDLPAAIDAVVRRATAAEAAARFAGVEEFVTAVRSALGIDRQGSAAVAVASGPVRNPYKGPRPFREVDATDFFGREEVVDRLAAAVGQRRLVAIVGPSGIGKSSVLRAGLVPALRAGMRTRDWLFADVLPGRDPFDELYAALARVGTHAPPDLLEDLTRDERGAVRAARRVLPSDIELVLLLDQFEELYTHVSDEALRARFLDSLTALAQDPHGRVRLVVVLRADFFDRPLGHPGFGALLGESTFALAAPDRVGIGDAIAEPARAVGVELEAGLVERIMTDLVGQPGALPLMQHALTELFSARTSDVLTIHGYEATGGVAGALGRRAEQLYQGLSPERRDIVRRVFQRLVTVAGGTGETRRRVRRRELEGIGRAGAVEEVLEAFGAHRLLTFDFDRASRAPTVEVAHEAIIDAWPRLREWLDTDRETLVVHRSLTDAATDWVRADRDESVLFRGTRLARVAAWADEDRRLDLNADEAAFLDASLALERRDREEREAAAAVELQALRRAADAERRRAEDQAAAAMRLRRRALVLAVTLFVAAVAAAVALWQRGEAERQAAVARIHEVAAVAVAEIDRDPERAVLLALNAVEQALAIDGTIPANVGDSLHRAVQASAIVSVVPNAHAADILALDVAPDGSTFATAGADGRVAKWRLSADAVERLWSVVATDGRPGDPPASDVFDVAFSPDGRLLATAGDDGSIRILDAANGTEIRRLRGHEHIVRGVTFGPPGSDLVASVAWDSTARLWSVTTGQEVRTMSDGEPLRTVRFAPDGGSIVVFGQDGVVRRWSTDGRLLRRYGPWAGPRGEAAFTSDGRWLAVAGEDNVVRLLDPASGEPAKVLPGHANSVEHLALDGTGGLAATAGSDSTARIWDLRAGRELMTLVGHAGTVADVGLTADGSRAVSVGATDRTIRVWDIRPGNELATWGTSDPDRPGARGPTLVGLAEDLVVVRQDTAESVRFDFRPSPPSGSIVAPASSVVLPVVPTPLMFAAGSPNGRRIAVWRQLPDGTPELTIWDTETAARIASVTELPEEPVYLLLFGPDGRVLASAGFRRRVDLWDAESGRRIATWEEPEVVNGIAFSPDGRLVATGTSREGTVRIRDARTTELIRELAAHDGSNMDLEFSADGRWLAAGGRDGRTIVWDTASWAETHRVSGSPEVIFVALSADGRRLATAGSDGALRIWSLDDGVAKLQATLLIPNGTASGPGNLSFSPDATQLYVSTSDGVVRAYVVEVEDLVALARSRVTRQLSRDECETFLSLAACPSLP